MPEKTEDGKWRWGNITRDTKGELVKVVYGIWLSQGCPGTWHDFWYSGNPYGEKKSKKSRKKKNTQKNKRVEESISNPYSFVSKFFQPTFNFGISSK